MKTLSLTLLLTAFLLNACVSDEDFDIPHPLLTPIEPKGTPISIEALRSALLQEIEQNDNDVLTINTPSYITGYVISDDRQGNFFKELILQDQAENPDYGVKLLIDTSPLFPYYQPGRKVYVQLSGLSVAFDGGVLTLGIRNGNRLGNIAESAVFDHLIRDTLVQSIIPVETTISALIPEQTNTFISLQEVQFHRSIAIGENRITFAGEPGDEFDGERKLESCSETASIIVSTSVFADFKSVLLPEGQGTIEGIFTYNFFGDTFNLVLNDMENIKFMNPDRCDPPEIDCGVAAQSGTQVLFFEDFESQIPGEPVSGNGWTNIAEEGTETWKAYSESGANASLGISAHLGSYNSGDISSVAWLITPETDFSLHQQETLQFRTSNSFADDSFLEVLFSSNWDGNPESLGEANWELLSAAVVVQDGDPFGSWISSGKVDLDCIDSNGYIAWRYTGSGDPENDGTYELDEIRILANE